MSRHKHRKRHHHQSLTEHKHATSPIAPPNTQSSGEYTNETPPDAAISARLQTKHEEPAQSIQHTVSHRKSGAGEKSSDERGGGTQNQPAQNERAPKESQDASTELRTSNRYEHQRQSKQHEQRHQNRHDTRLREPRSEDAYKEPSHKETPHREEHRGEKCPQGEVTRENMMPQEHPRYEKSAKTHGKNVPSSPRDGHRQKSRSTPLPELPTPEFIPVGSGIEKPEQLEELVAARQSPTREEYEPFVPTTPARGSDDIFYKDFDPLFKGARGLAIKILSRLEQSDSYLDKLLEYELANSDLKALDRALLTEIVHGVTRWQAKLDWVLTGFYHGEFVKCIMPVKNAMRIALYQIMFLQKIPPFAAVNESVELVKRLKGPRSANLVNAILRNILHNLNNIRYPNRHEDVPRHLSIVYSHPFWMTKRWYDRYGESEAELLLKTNNDRPKITLRLNMMRCNRQELLNFLDSQEIKYWDSPFDKERLLMVGSLSAVREWKPFQDGWFTVQDPSAAMVVKLANPQAGQRIYDVCAAPGGKTTFAAELTNDTAEILAMDKYGGKLHLIDETAKRLGLTSITTQAQDVRHFKTKDLADLVMVDVPCSGLGTLAKKPDIKWKFDLVDFPPLVRTQREIVSAAARLVKTGGTLVYSTCTIEPEENEKQIEWFLQQFPEFELDPAENYLPQELCTNGFLQTLPHKHQADGAFAARLVKKR